MTSQEVKNLLHDLRIFQWELAREMGVGEHTLCRWLRDGTLTPEREQQIRKAINAMYEEPVV